MNLIEDFISLLFPNTCQSCNTNLLKSEEVICTSCLFHLPKTNFHLIRENAVSKIFWGRVNLHAASAYYYYRKGNKVQHLIHQLKYRGQKEIGIFLGKLYGLELIKSHYYNSADLIIPIPLHEKKLRSRGFNQAELFASGLSKSMKIRMATTLLKRETASSTQTKKSRYERWENVNKIFTIEKSEDLSGKTIIIVDDVITTGATMEACIQTIQNVYDTQVCAVALGFASS